MADLIFLLVLALIAWSICCVYAGRIYEVNRQLRDDLNAKDQWFTQKERA